MSLSLLTLALPSLLWRSGEEMAIRLSRIAIEKSSYDIPISFLDENKRSVIPNIVTWTLTTMSGETINSRVDVAETPAAEVVISLGGLDLAIFPGETGIVDRLVTVYSTYDSSLGNDRPLREAIIFPLQNLTAVE